MNKIKLSLVFVTTFCLTINISHAQWSTSGGLLTPTLTTAGKVGIGTNNPNELFVVKNSVEGNLASFVGPNSGLILQSNTPTFDLVGYSPTSGYKPVLIRSGSYGLSVGTNGFVGIGTITPENNLHIDGGLAGTSLKLGNTSSNRTAFWIGTDATGGNTTLQSWLSAGGGGSTLLLNPSGGKVGIGTSTPENSLHVDGGPAGTSFKLGNTNTDRTSFWINTDAQGGNTTLQSWWAGSGHGPSTLLINPNGGNVGIGTTNPTQKLTVKGTVYSTEVKVDINAGADYVFEKDYNLPSLNSIKTYIDKNKHLPEVPSAKEMEANGVNLGEMNMLLLKKIEELTLYQIEANQKIQTLQLQLIEIQKNGK